MEQSQREVEGPDSLALTDVILPSQFFGGMGGGGLCSEQRLMLAVLLTRSTFCKVGIVWAAHANAARSPRQPNGSSPKGPTTRFRLTAYATPSASIPKFFARAWAGLRWVTGRPTGSARDACGLRNRAAPSI